jgi:predicted ATPase
MRIADYEILDELIRNDWQVLSRARQRGGASTVLVKFPRRRPPRLADLELLKHEFELLERLAVPGTPRPLGLSEADEGSPLFLEDCGGVRLRPPTGSLAGDLDRFFPLALQLCSILAGLHRSDVIHRNLNPGSMLWDATAGKLTVVDFSSATLASGGMHHPLGAVLSPLALPYSSPEQTGRMNREVDHRTDFYSLGATLCELLTGSPPFASPDQLELIHWHIARAPEPPRERDPRVPETLSQIILKLLAKTPEERYQSAAGVREDLATCAAEWAEHRFIKPFALGRRDVTDRFLIPQRLYGREQEVRKLIDVFDQVCRGNTALTLVAGYSGIGKTSLIQELYRPIVHQKGYFLSGKFDQVVRSVPYGALLQAFRGLARRLLGESEERLAYWRQRLGEALGANGGVLTEVIPELVPILGEQPAPSLLGPTEAQNRFQMVFQSFLGALAAKDHPFVIFLDDLQWADSATLGLLEPLLTSADIRHLLLVGAYRDNEVDAGHPLLRALGRLHSAGAEVHQLTLGPLPAGDLSLLVADALGRQPADVEAVATLILRKTDGNPFFVIQFLKALRQDGLLEFDYSQGRWNFQLEAIAAAATTENVVDLMARKIRRLSAESQRILPLAACIGNRFDLATMATITEQPPSDALADLKEALREGLILQVSSPDTPPGDDDNSGEPAPVAYTFLHDRVQQAAYALIPEAEKQRVRLQVGRLLLDRWGDSEAKVFDVIEHLNFGSSRIATETERQELARLNLVAVRKAKSSTAYDAALGYAIAGVGLLGESSWESDYDLAFALHIEAAECEYLCGRFDAAEQRFGLLLERARQPIDKAAVHHLRLVQNENRSRYPDAVQCGREGLALLGVSFPDGVGAQETALENELASIQSLLAGRPIGSLVDLPAARDPEKRMVLRLLTSIWAPAYITANQVLTRLISATIVRLSLAHGSTSESAYGYVTHAITVGPVREDFETAYEWGKLALSVNERFPDPQQRAKIHQQFHAHVTLWRKPFATCIPHAREACRSGLEAGDFNYAAYGAFTESWVAFLICEDLGRFVTEQSSNLALLQKMKMTDPLGALTVIVNWARALQGQTADGLSLSYESFDEKIYRETYGANAFFMAPYYVIKLSLCLTFEAYGPALEAALRARQIVQTLSGTIWPVVLDFLYGLTVAALYREQAEQQRSLWMGEVSGIRRSLDVLAANCPENFGCYSLLLRAEMARVEGRDIEAVHAFEEAIRLAQTTGNTQNSALAQELYSRFWRDSGNDGVAGFYLRQATQLYAQWGAAAKVRSLARRWPELLGAAAPLRSSETGSESAVSDVEPAHAALDLATVTKAARAISQEIDLNALLQKLMQIAIENAGAQRGLLLREKEGRLIIEAEGWVDREDVQVGKSAPLDARTDVSRSIVHYVHKTRESVVLGNAARDDRLRNDPYVASSPHLSILCVPIEHQGKSQGILYLENGLAGEAFTADRARLMQLLASQAGISLENSRLYEEMRQEALWRGEAEQTLRSVVEGTASVTGDDFFRSLVRHLASALGVRYAFVTQCLADNTRARMLAFWNGGDFGECTEYDAGTTPCKTVLDGGTAFYPRQIQALFPEDADLVALSAESYVGVPMFGAGGRVIGHLAVLDVGPMADSQQRTSVLRIFAARAAAELERLHAEDGLRAAMAEVERLKNRLQAENVYLQEEIRREHNFDEIVGGSPVLLQLLTQVEDVAPTDTTVLIYGETGTGKELIARAIHDRSRRRDRPLVKVNCGAISAGLVESELFGHVKGAFTGALDRRAGRFELANSGTIFLDEVGELPLETQVKLLRVLQEQEFEPVGSSRTQRVDVRVIAATNRDLDKEVAAGRFRLDLFYRLNVLPLSVPPLRERPSDIPQLVAFFLSRFSRKSGKKIDSVSQETMGRLVRYSWPGNIRELQNIIERAFVLSRGSVLSLDGDLLPIGAMAARAQSPAGPAGFSTPSREASAGSPSPAADGPTALNEVEKQHILAVLAQTSWIIEGPGGAAKLLHLHPNTLRSRLKKLGIRRPTHDIS